MFSGDAPTHLRGLADLSLGNRYGASGCTVNGFSVEDRFAKCEERGFLYAVQRGG